jgi:hypothetical protein
VVTDPRDEARHEPGADENWSETFHCDFFAGDASLGGYVTVTLLPNGRFAWFWASLVGEGRRLVTVIDNEAPLPRRRTLELRTSGLWCEIQVEVPLDHLTVGMESFGVALDEPADVFGSLRGDLTPLGFDLEWETERDPMPLADGYELRCRVHGEILVGQERIDFDGWGARHHVWGTHAWWRSAWRRASGRFDDGTWIDASDEPSVTQRIAEAPLPLASFSRLHRTLARFERDGRAGAGWFQRNEP